MEWVGGGGTNALALSFVKTERRRKAIAGGGEGSSCECYAPVTGYMHRLLLFFSTGCKFTGFFCFRPRSNKLKTCNHVDQRSRKQRLWRPPQLHKQQQHHSTLKSERGKHCPNLEKKTQTNRDTKLPLFESTCSYALSFCCCVVTVELTDILFCISLRLSSSSSSSSSNIFSMD